jgi:hypothetical protein
MDYDSFRREQAQKLSKARRRVLNVLEEEGLNAPESLMLLEATKHDLLHDALYKPVQEGQMEVSKNG